MMIPLNFALAAFEHEAVIAMAIYQCECERLKEVR